MYAQSFSEWLAPISGDWENPSLWSTVPNVPNNGFPNPDDLYDVMIAASGAPYQVLVDGSSPVVNSLTLDSIDATVTIESGRVFTASNGIELNAGVFQLAGGQLHDTMVTGDGRVEIIRPMFGSQLPEFVNVVLAADLYIQTNNSLRVSGGLELVDSVITLNSPGSPASSGVASISSNGDLDLTGTGTVLFSRTRDGQRGALGAANGQLMVAQDISLLLHEADGTIGHHLGTMHNAGLISVDNGWTLDLVAGSWTNAGRIEVLSGSTLAVDSEITTAALGDIEVSGGSQFEFEGLLNNQGHVLSIGGEIEHFQLWNWDSRIEGGTIEVVNAGVFEIRRSSLHGVTLRGHANVVETGIITGGLHLDQATLVGNVGFVGTQTITGEGEIVLGDGDPFSLYTSGLSNGAVLTLGEDVLLRTGFDGSQFDGFTGQLNIEGQLVTNHSLFMRTSINNAGIIRIEDRGTRFQFFNGNTFSNSGRIEIAENGSLTIDTAANVTHTHTGEIVVAGGLLSYDGELSIAALGVVLVQSGSVHLLGTLDLAGETLDFGSTFIGATPTFREGISRIENGTISDSVGSGLLLDTSFDGLILRDVTINTDIQIYNNNVLHLEGQITLGTGHRIFIGCAPPGVSQGGTIRGLQTAMIDGGGEIVLGGNESTPASIGVSDFTLGTGLTIRTQDGSGLIGGVGGIDGTIINRGLIATADDGNHLRVLARELYNEASGRIIVSDGATFQVEAGNGPFNRADLVSNRGLIAVLGSNSIVTLNSLSTENLGEIEIDGGQMHLLGDLVLAESGTLVLHLGSDEDPAFEMVRVSNSVAIDGLLVINVDEGLDLEFGDRFQLITAQNYTGVFSEIILPEIAGVWDTSLFETNGLIQVVSIDGDLNGDGFVGAADLDVVLANWGQSVGLGDRAHGDHTGDGFVNDADLQVVMSHFGNGIPPGTNIPEPGTYTLLSLLGMVFGRHRWRKVATSPSPQ